jgi:hypothetical protein
VLLKPSLQREDSRGEDSQMLLKSPGEYSGPPPTNVLTHRLFDPDDQKQPP